MISQTTNVLPRIADRLTRDALARPGALFKREFKNGAVCALVFDSPSRTLELTITRKGLSPHNDFSSEGSKRRAAWEREVTTFALAFGVPLVLPNAALRSDGAKGMFYFAVYRWVLDSQQAASHERAA